MFHVSTQLPYEKHDPQKVSYIILIDEFPLISAGFFPVGIFPPLIFFFLC